MKSIKKQVIEAITTSYNLEDAASKLGTSRRELLRMREAFQIQGLECMKRETLDAIKEVEEGNAVKTIDEKDMPELIDLFTPKYSHNKANETLIDKLNQFRDKLPPKNETAVEKQVRLFAEITKQPEVLEKFKAGLKESNNKKYEKEVLAKSIETSKKIIEDSKSHLDENQHLINELQNTQMDKKPHVFYPRDIFKNHPIINPPSILDSPNYTSANDIVKAMKAVQEQADKGRQLAKDMGELAAKQSSDINTIAQLSAIQSAVCVKKQSHGIIPDMQVTPGNLDSCKSSLLAIANYFNKVQPTIIIWLGDFWDMESIREYKKGDFDSNAYKRDIKAGNDAMSYFQSLLTYKPQRQVFTCGNHEGRIGRVKKMDKSVDAFISYDDLNLKQFGVEFVDFMLPIEVDGIFYCHYFSSGPMGKSIQSARMLLMKKHNNICQGHIQHFQQHIEILPNGRPITGLMAGCSYEHELDYLGPYQGTHYARQIWYCSDVSDGRFNPERIGMEVIRNLA